MHNILMQYFYKVYSTEGFPGGSVVKNLPAKLETRVRSLGQEDLLDKEMAILNDQTATYSIETYYKRMALSLCYTIQLCCLFIHSILYCLIPSPYLVPPRALPQL